MLSSHAILHAQYALIESKKMYVRYISHELRTPLNSAFLGKDDITRQKLISEASDSHTLTTYCIDPFMYNHIIMLCRPI
jgi:signal transduction histidine kinase